MKLFRNNETETEQTTNAAQDTQNTSPQDETLALQLGLQTVESDPFFQGKRYVDLYPSLQNNHQLH